VAGRFRFRLESVLKLRRSLEEVAQRDLARAVAAQEAVRALLAQLHQAQLDTVELRRAGAGQAIDLLQWKSVERFLVVLERRVAQAQAQLREAEARVAAARQALVQAHRNHLMLVRLKERRQEQHTLESQREEARDMDEMAVLRYRITPAAQALREVMS
jgi:flagellar FliJ protein